MAGVTLVPWALGTMAARLPFSLAIVLGLALVTAGGTVVGAAVLSSWLSIWPTGLRLAAPVRAVWPTFRTMLTLSLLTLLAASLFRVPWASMLAAALLVAAAIAWPLVGRGLSLGALWLEMVGIALALVGSWGLRAFPVRFDGLLPPAAALPVVGVSVLAIFVLEPRGAAGRGRSWRTRMPYGAGTAAAMLASVIVARRYGIAGTGPRLVLAHVMGSWAPTAIVGLLAATLVTGASVLRGASTDTGSWKRSGGAAGLTVMTLVLSAIGMRAAVPGWARGVPLSAVVLSGLLAVGLVLLWGWLGRTRPAETHPSA